MSNKQKFVAAATAVTLVATATTPFVQAKTFQDVNNHTYEKPIVELVNRGIISGYADNTFKPNKTLTRSDVVKILGKYLVSLGYDIPSDYKSNIRFTDLSTRSNDELLKYAALVKDVGVFNGDRGRLLGANRLTNEQAANVLVRAFSEIDAFDYVAFVESQTFFKEFEDTASLTGESKQSVNVIDYYDIVTRNSFFPKQTITRGAFASMLYEMMEIEKSADTTKLYVHNIIAVSPTRLTVTLSDLSSHNVYLDEALVENVPTVVSFTINGEAYEGRATYHTKQLEITDVENVNGGQFVVHFNQEVDLPTTNSSTDLHKIFALTKVGTTTTHTLQKGELSADKRSYTVTLDSKTALSGTYRLKIEGVRALNGKSLADFDENVYFVTDTTRPTVKSIENLSKTRVKVTFSEPVYTNTSAITYTRANGTAVTGITATYNDSSYNATTNKTDIIFDLKNISLSDFGAINVNMTDVRDIAGNMMTAKDATFKIQKGGPDNSAPKLMSVEQVGAKQFKLQFDEAMDTIHGYQLNVSSDDSYYYVENVQQYDPTSFIVTVDDFLDGVVTISSNKSYPLKDATGTNGHIEKTYAFSYDTTRAVIEHTETVREDNTLYLYVYFDRNVVVDELATVRLNGAYKFNQNTYKLTQPQAATVYATDDPRIVKIPVKELMKNYDREGSLIEGELQFSHVFNEYKIPVANGSVQFERKSDFVYNTEVLQLLSVDTSRTSKDVTNSKQLVLNFNNPVDSEGVDDLFNYDLMGYELESAAINIANPRQVILTVKSTINTPVEPYLYVYNLKSLNSMLDMEVFYERVYLNENVAPTYHSVTVTSAKEIKLTFSEALNPIDERAFYVTDSTGEAYVTKASIDPTNSSRVVLTLEKELRSYSTVKIRLLPGREIRDIYYNLGTFNEITHSVGRIPTN